MASPSFTPVVVCLKRASQRYGRRGLGSCLTIEPQPLGEAGEAWETVSSRVITARLKAARAGQRRPGGSRETGNIFVSLISVYTPTAKAPPGIKEKFMDDLQDAIDRTPASDILLLLGDFNARVGKSTADDDEWREVRGGHGVGCCNAAGERFLEF